MINFDRWRSMSLVERQLYEDNVRRAKKIMAVCGILFIALTVITATALYLHQEGIL